MTCVVCGRHLDAGVACDACRLRLDHTLEEIRDLHARLPDALERGANGSQKVAGSREAPLPLRVDPLDLSLPYRGHRAVSDPNHDQAGHIPAATQLDSWAREWHQSGAPGDTLPPPTVPRLIHWLRARLPWACDRHPAVDEFATAMQQLLRALRAVHGLGRQQAELIYVPCRGCDQMTLYRRPGDDRVYCDDDDCRLVLWPDEYQRWTKLLAGHVAT